MATKTVLITGGNRGIGLAFAQHYVKQGWNVIATARNVDGAEELKNLKPRKILTLDTGDEQSILSVAKALEGVAVDLLINNSGISIGGGLDVTTKEDLMRQFEVNTVGPFLLTRALLPNLRLAVAAHGQAFVAQITSRMGSIADNGSGGSYGYRASKTALNMVTQSLALDLQQEKIGCLLLHPGHVNTAIINFTGTVEADDSVAGMLGLVTPPPPAPQAPAPVYTGPKRTVLITGADNCTGVAFVQHYMREGWDVIAACPEGEMCFKVMQLAPWKIVAMDPGYKDSVDAAAEALMDVPIDLLINNARLFTKGYMHSTTPEDCIHQYEVNALGPFIVSRALLQNLRLGVRDRGMAFVANVSSRVGSISENLAGGSYGFRASMSALHMFTKTLVADFLPHKIGCVLLHSGIDDKPDGVPSSADVRPEESVAGMAQVIARTRLGEPLHLRHFGNGDAINW
ncbi:5-hydroxyisourate hydrolase [Phytophthora nicotianae]|uniref:5-hydroxyisourate hydrolase n=1 Tax=Phytophthora nicotianae TaxID=4792 RepID=A0A0W8DQK2_PHYNI|nr:5-hydroxyisourate hydrolase [Phytophthora nicotianae]